MGCVAVVEAEVAAGLAVRRDAQKPASPQAGRGAGEVFDAAVACIVDLDERYHVGAGVEVFPLGAAGSGDGVSHALGAGEEDARLGGGFEVEEVAGDAVGPAFAACAVKGGDGRGFAVGYAARVDGADDDFPETVAVEVCHGDVDGVAVGWVLPDLGEDVVVCVGRGGCPDDEEYDKELKAVHGVH